MNIVFYLRWHDVANLSQVRRFVRTGDAALHNEPDRGHLERRISPVFHAAWPIVARGPLFCTAKSGRRKPTPWRRHQNPLSGGEFSLRGAREKRP